MAKLHLLSDHSNSNQRPSATNLLDELSVQVKNGEVEVEDLLVVYLEKDGSLSVLTTRMPRHKAVGMLTYAAHLQM